MISQIVSHRVISLPLMGIGNDDALAHAARDPRLTTPHGDRKPPRMPGASSPIRCSHYPSWGSETLPLRKWALGIYLSLPLMGIGNSRADTSSPCG